MGAANGTQTPKDAIVFHPNKLTVIHDQGNDTELMGTLTVVMLKDKISYYQTSTCSLAYCMPTSNAVDIPMKDIKGVSRYQSMSSAEPGVVIKLRSGDVLQMSPITTTEFENIERNVPFGVSMASSLHDVNFSEYAQDEDDAPTYKGGAVALGPMSP